ncbi:MAG: hypothetical protein IM585_21720 [Pseudanabaena sp. M135S2SP2A07QC]|jgi:PIN domain nuclease of toxin-antitoxin system|nr:hypothetical protein [Pseudanabaena sp. M179S2SP2A07QC]MCA6532086.1 hypothetical protein [Pseudanabaena sp. M125S2SP2A07QC]MCA6537006.1 hypothetical protein [Pseudanabaena sp. M176S2SP2A07QC]MCA6541628.1 hypothetical protein [Pseudanabaena sp. M037S2SP2A07QC]MCA6544612.1 hypothetical protein [Pseudanabaena sp. M074S1SP2A07QC]MCA6547896.1 hypothetical protein [Pseudanabaena sp. M152S2SP2A07QC]MCA6554518.1 hypothetical protein [Pseudanabaena sp. M135S2SP2A07QC]MCA6558296.1 hypothetical prot
MYQIVDTNVLLVASKKAPQASETCELSCEKYLQNLMHAGVLVIDSHWLIIKEYMHKNSQSGQPNAGDKFLKWVLLNHTNPNRCEKVTITQIAENDFAEFPKSPSLQKFDPSDRKFVAVALTHHAKPAIANAVDSDWRNYEIALADHSVSLNFLCPELTTKN